MRIDMSYFSNEAENVEEEVIIVSDCDLIEIIYEQLFQSSHYRKANNCDKSAVMTFECHSSSRRFIKII